MSRNKFTLPQERTVLYLGSSKKDIEGFPKEVQKEIALAISLAKLGGKHQSAKPWKGLGSAVFEIVQDDGDAYRAIYTVEFKQAVYVLYAFQKKATEGRKTAKRDVDLVKKRLRRARQDHRERYGASKKKR
jgi:phage-related protein